MQETEENRDDADSVPETEEMQEGGTMPNNLSQEIFNDDDNEIKSNIHDKRRSMNDTKEGGVGNGKDDGNTDS